MPGASGASSAALPARRRAAGRARARSSSRATPPGRSSVGSLEAGDDGRIRRRPASARRRRPVDAAAQIGEHVRRAGRRHMAGAVGRRRHHRPAERRQQRLRHRMRGHAHRDAVEPGGRQFGHRAVRPLRQHQRQRPRPERRGELLGVGVEARRARAPRRRSRTCAISGLNAGRPLAA